MNIVILGATGFIGTNLLFELAKDSNNVLKLVDVNEEYFNHIKNKNIKADYVVSDFSESTNFDEILKDQDIVYHLFSTSNPSTSNVNIPQEMKDNVMITTLLLDACVRNDIKKIVFLSSGGTVYGNEAVCPIVENTPTKPISTYGVHKVTIENLLYLYNYIYNLDYRIIRLSNPYGPYQRPNGVLGAVTTFIYKALKGKSIEIYGNGNVVRDFIYIDDAIKAIINITNGPDKLFNLGSGIGLSINNLLETISNTLNIEMDLEYKESRSVDVSENYLDISHYEQKYGNPITISLSEGIERTADFLVNYYE